MEPARLTKSRLATGCEGIVLNKCDLMDIVTSVDRIAVKASDGILADAKRVVA